MKSYALTAAMAVLVAGSFLACDKSGKTFNLGGVAPATGEAATFGVASHNGIDLAVSGDGADLTPLLLRHFDFRPQAINALLIGASTTSTTRPSVQQAVRQPT